MELKEALERLDHNIPEAEKEAWDTVGAAFTGTQHALITVIKASTSVWTNGLAVGVIATSLIIFLVNLIF